MSSSLKKFALGFTLTLFVALVINAVPFLLTRGAYNGDRFEVAGFPFTFHRLGGIAGIYEFHAAALLSDILLSVAAALVAGYACSRLSRRE